MVRAHRVLRPESRRAARFGEQGVRLSGRLGAASLRRRDFGLWARGRRLRILDHVTGSHRWHVRTLVGGVVLAGLGLLWSLQGADLVHVRPVLCVTDCRPVTGGSVGWLVAGLVAFVLGVVLVARSRPRPH